MAFKTKKTKKINPRRQKTSAAKPTGKAGNSRRVTAKSAAKKPSAARTADKKRAAVYAAKKTPAPVPTPPNEAFMQNILAKGRSRSFVTETELLYVFPRLEHYIYSCELFLETLNKNGIQIIENTENFLSVDAVADNAASGGKLKEFLDSVQNKKKFDITEFAADSIQMYLREIGKVT